MELSTASNYAFLSHTFPPVKNNCKVDINSKMYIHRLSSQPRWPGLYCLPYVS